MLCPRKASLLYPGIVSSNHEDVKRMAHTTKDKEKLLNRVRRIKGQITAIEKALDSGEECSKPLPLAAVPSMGLWPRYLRVTFVFTSSILSANLRRNRPKQPRNSSIS